MPKVEEILDARGKVYGDFTDVSRVAQSLKAIMRAEPKWRLLTAVQMEAMDLTATKLARIVTGGAEHSDNYLDIAGYAKLAADRVENTS